MFYVISKTLDAFLSPLTWTLLFAVLALALSRKRPRLAVVSALLAIAILAIFSSEPVANGLWRSLEKDVHSTVKSGVSYDAVILLSGMVDDGSTETHGQPAYNDNVERLLTTFEILRSGQAKNVLVSGGSGRFGGGGTVEADVLQKQLVTWGIDPSRIVEERQSRNTRENATESAKIIAQKGWTSLLLVTSAYHMPRALGCFERAGVHPDVMPVDFRSGDYIQSVFPRAGGLAVSTSALRELSGRLIYKLAGYVP